MEEISASAAYTRSKTGAKGGFAGNNDTNYTLTLARLFETIKRESDAGKKRIAFMAPLFVMDGTLADPVLLAKQIKVKLTRLGYDVDRSGDMLHISWDREEIAPPHRTAPPVPVSTPARTAVRISNTSGPPRGYAAVRKTGAVSVRRVTK